MDEAFWHERWRNDEIGFHQHEVNAHLQQYWSDLGVESGDQVLVPLCGKSLDMLWLLQAGHPVLGVELSQSACESFFAENKLTPAVSSCDRYRRFRVPDLELLCGDFFRLSRADLAQVRAVYDRAALVALPDEIRQRYVQQLLELLPDGVKILLVTLQRPSAGGPPFTVTDEEVFQHFSGRFNIRRMQSAEAWDRPGWTEVVWLLTDKSGV